MTITKILIIGSWELCIAIINAFFPPEATDGADNIGITILTYPSQTLSLPKHVPSSCIRHKTSDFSSPSLQTTFKNHDIVISTISGGDSALQKLIIDATIAAGVSRFIPHEFGHDTLSEEVQSRITKYAGRARVIEYLRSVALRNKDFEWTAIATGYTLDSALLSGNLGFDLTWHSATVHGSGTEAFAASSLNRVGQVVKRVITKWDDFKNQYIYAAGCITSANKILVALEKATRQEFSVGNHDVKDCVREGNSRIEKGFLDAGMVLLERSVLYDEQLGAVKAFTERTANRLLGLEEENVEVVVEHVVHDLKHRGTPDCGCR